MFSVAIGVFGAIGLPDRMTGVQTLDLARTKITNTRPEHRAGLSSLS